MLKSGAVHASFAKAACADAYGAPHIYATTFVQWPNWQPLDYYEVYLAAENFNTSKMLLNYVSSHFKWSQYC